MPIPNQNPPVSWTQLMQTQFQPAPFGFQRGLGLFGDSLTQNGYVTSTSSTSVDVVQRSWGWATWVGPMSMQQVQVINSWAANGSGVIATGGTLLEDQITQALSSSSWPYVSTAVILIGTNDSAYDIPTFISRLLVQIDRLSKPVVLMTPPPRGGTVTVSVGSGFQLWSWLMELRAQLRRVADQSGGWITYVDAYSQVNSPTTVPDVIQAGYTYDNIHWNSAGAYRAANAFINAVLPTGITNNFDIWTNSAFASSTGAAQLDQGFQNPVLGTATGGTLNAGITGTGAGSLTFTAIAGGSAVASVISNPNGFGNMQRLEITSAADNDGIDVTTSSFHNVGPDSNFLQAGDVAWAQAVVTINSGGIFPKNLFFRLTGFANPVNYNALWSELDTSKVAALPLTATRTFLLRTPLLTVPTGVTFSSLTIKFRPVFAAAGACTIDIGNIECRRFRSDGVYT